MFWLHKAPTCGVVGLRTTVAKRHTAEEPRHYSLGTTQCAISVPLPKWYQNACYCVHQTQKDDIHHQAGTVPHASGCRMGSVMGANTDAGL